MKHFTAHLSHRSYTLLIVSVLLVCAVLVLALVAHQYARPNASGTDSPTSTPSSSTSPSAKSGTDPLDRKTTPQPANQPQNKAKRAVAAMSLEERVGQLIMAPLFAGTDPSALQDLITNQYVGSVLIIGNWNDGVASVRAVTDALQSYAPASNHLLMTTDQEGGLVQHLQGPGFDDMPSAVEQGMMTTDALRKSAATWGAQLKQAGINVDLAPVLGTVVGERAANAPIGALDRDFGLDATGNAAHGTAFVQGMRDAGVESSVKHYPGLGAVSGNTDFTAEGVLDTTTTQDGPEMAAFAQTIHDATPGMVMMSLATYQQLDAASPAAFSSTIIDGMLRGKTGYDGVVTSDSLSATAVSGIPVDQLGVRLIEAGGDLACIGNSTYVQPILDGLLAKARTDDRFAAKVTRSAERVMTLKYRMRLAS